MITLRSLSSLAGVAAFTAGLLLTAPLPVLEKAEASQFRKLNRIRVPVEKKGTGARRPDGFVAPTGPRSTPRAGPWRSGTGAIFKRLLSWATCRLIWKTWVKEAGPTYSRPGFRQTTRWTPSTFWGTVIWLKLKSKWVSKLKPWPACREPRSL